MNYSDIPSLTNLGDEVRTTKYLMMTNCIGPHLRIIRDVASATSNHLTCPPKFGIELLRVSDKRE